MQPSGESITVCTVYENKRIAKDTISGRADLIYDVELEKKSDEYKKILESVPDWKDLEKILVSVESDACCFQILKKSKFLSVNQVGDILKIYSGKILLREAVIDKLERIAEQLYYETGLRLDVVYGYRPIKRQVDLFKQEMDKHVDKIPDENERKSFIHKIKFAVPEVVGHPIGAAVDVQIVKDEILIDFGTKIWDFVDVLTFSLFINEVAKSNRLLLRKYMMAE
ncbi:MAG: D-alanyl-D-alanine carboxypeptidase family protein [Methanobrevibacter sp.]|nr:D-alanyl-D-alanine carboxypeptidase family protein [Methanobrevibacter sp.]